MRDDLSLTAYRSTFIIKLLLERKNSALRRYAILNNNSSNATISKNDNIITLADVFWFLLQIDWQQSAANQSSVTCNSPRKLSG